MTAAQLDLVKSEAQPANGLQRAIQDSITRPLTHAELEESEQNLVGLFSVLLKIRQRQQRVDRPGAASYAHDYESRHTRPNLAPRTGGRP